MPNVCGDVSAWAASGYRALPASTPQFDQQFSSEDVGIGEVPARLLAPYEDHSEQAVLQHAHQFEQELVDAEARAVEPWATSASWICSRNRPESVFDPRSGPIPARYRRSGYAKVCT